MTDIIAVSLHFIIQNLNIKIFIPEEFPRIFFPILPLFLLNNGYFPSDIPHFSKNIGPFSRFRPIFFLKVPFLSLRSCPPFPQNVGMNLPNLRHKYPLFLSPFPYFEDFLQNER